MRHARFGFEQPLIHVHVEQVRPRANLIQGHRECGFVIVGLDEPAKKR